MKGFIEITTGRENKRLSIAVAAIVSVKEFRQDEANITLTEIDEKGKNVDLYLKHSYDEIMQKIEQAS